MHVKQEHIIDVGIQRYGQHIMRCEQTNRMRINRRLGVRAAAAAKRKPIHKLGIAHVADIEQRDMHPGVPGARFALLADTDQQPGTD